MSQSTRLKVFPSFVLGHNQKRYNNASRFSDCKTLTRRHRLYGKTTQKTSQNTRLQLFLCMPYIITICRITMPDVFLMQNPCLTRYKAVGKKNVSLFSTLVLHRHRNKIFYSVAQMVERQLSTQIGIIDGRLQRFSFSFVDFTNRFIINFFHNLIYIIAQENIQQCQFIITCFF